MMKTGHQKANAQNVPHLSGQSTNPFIQKDTRHVRIQPVDHYLSTAVGFHTCAELFLAVNLGFGAATGLPPDADSGLAAKGKLGTT